VGFAWAGASLAVVTLCRPTTACSHCFCPCYCHGVDPEQKAGVYLAYVLTVVAVIAPWTYHNWRTYHRFLPLTVSVDPLVWEPGILSPDAASADFLDIWANELNPQRNGGHDPHTIDGDRYFTRRAISDPGEPCLYVRYSLKKLLYLWLGNPVVEWPYSALYKLAEMRQWYPYSSQKLSTCLWPGNCRIIACALAFLAVRAGSAACASSRCVHTSP